MALEKCVEKARECAIVLHGKDNSNINCITVWDLTDKDTWLEFVKQQTTTKENLNVNPNGLQPGIVYIIINSTFDKKLNLPKIEGCDKDINRVKKTFGEKFHLTVRLMKDKTKKEINEEMEKISKENFKKNSCLVMVIISHGFRHNTIAAKDEFYNLEEDIRYPILRNENLVSKLKLFLVDVCAVERKTDKYVECKINSESKSKKPTQAPTDILGLYSCTQGYASFRDPEKGSYFFSVVCDDLNRDGMDKDIKQVLDNSKCNIITKHENLQIPELILTPTKEFVFGHYVPQLKAKQIME